MYGESLSGESRLASFITWDLHLESGVLRWSDRVSPLFDFSKGETQTNLEDFLRFVHSQDRKGVRDSILDCVAKGAGFSLEHRTVRSDGTVGWISQRGSVVLGRDGTVRRVLGVAQDVTEHKLAEHKLLLMNDVLQKIARGEPIEIILGDILSGVEGLMHGSICSLLVLRGNQLYSGAANRLPDFYNDAIDGVEIGDGVGSCGTAAFRNERVIVENIHEHPYWKPFRELVKQANIGACWSEPIRFTEETPFGTFAIYYGEPRSPNAQELSIIHDAAQLASVAMLRERHEKSLNQAMDDALRANSAKTDFLSKMSHELRTPLNAIIGFSQLLGMDDSLTVEQSDSVLEVHRAGQHLLGLINDVIDLSRIESGNIKVCTEAVHVWSVIDHAINLTANLAEKKRVSVVRKPLSGGSDFIVQADETRLRQVLLNLLSNAIKYNRDGGEVRIEVTQVNPEHVCIAVEDTGMGISDEDLSKLFIPFDRLGAEKTAIEGTGIGLVIIKQLIELMEGSIQVESRSGRGSTFTVTLRSAVGSKHGSEPAGSDELNATLFEADASASVGTVVYIEDNPVNQKVMQCAMKRRPSLQLVSSTSPDEGLALVKERQPALVLMDINLPGMSGFELFELLKQDRRTRSIPVIAISANAMPKDIERAKDCGFEDYLTKPIDLKILYRMLDHYLG